MPLHSRRSHQLTNLDTPLLSSDITLKGESHRFLTHSQNTTAKLQKPNIKKRTTILILPTGRAFLPITLDLKFLTDLKAILRKRSDTTVPENPYSLAHICYFIHLFMLFYSYFIYISILLIILSFL